MNKFNFNPANGFMDSTAFPNPTTESATREQFQRIPNQLKDYINQVVATYGAEVVTFRITNDLTLQFSTDGTTWQDLTSGSNAETVAIATTDWVSSTYGVSCTKAVTGVKATDKLHFSVEVDMTSASYQAMINARAFVQDVESGANQITVYATNAPTVNINLDIWGW